MTPIPRDARRHRESTRDPAAAHQRHDLGPFRGRVLEDCREQRTEDVLALRDDVQHQLERVAALTTGGQIWGYVSWAGIDDRGDYTGKWLMISPGASYVGDSWVFVGPASLPFPVRPGRIRLNAFGRRVYLARSLDAVIEATLWITDELSNGRVRAVDSPASDRRGSDKVYEGHAEVLVSTSMAEEVLQDAD